MTGGDFIYLRDNEGTVEYQLNSTSGSWSTATFPVTFTATAAATVQLTTNMTFTADDQYIIIGSNNITVDGQFFTATVTGETSWPGLFQNLSYTVTIQNINMILDDETDTAIASNGSGFCRNNFVTGTILNCSVIGGTIGNACGGIVGANSEDMVVTGCYCTSAIGASGGGIIGSSSTGATVTSCYATGNISSSGGGIIGSGSENATVTDCYATGTIGLNGGGIVGSNPTGLTITDCYTSGTGDGDGIVAGTEADPANTYSELFNGSDGWSDANTDVLSGDYWVSIGIDTPYRLLTFNKTLYSSSTITTSASTYTGTAGLLENNTYSIVAVNEATVPVNFDINIDTGVLSINNAGLSTTAAYTITIYAVAAGDVYNINILNYSYLQALGSNLVKLLLAGCGASYVDFFF